MSPVRSQALQVQAKPLKALVLASSQGIGLAIASELHRDGAQVVLCSRTPKNLEAAKKITGIKHSISADLTRTGVPKKTVQSAIRLMGGLDILVINSGGPKKAALEDLSSKDWQEGFRLVWLSGVEAIEAALPALKKSGRGRIIWITSTAAREPIPKLNISSSLRAGILGLTKTMSQEFGKYGITVNAVLPGFTATERLKELKIPTEAITAQMSTGRLVEPTEIGYLASFLASDRAASITGQSIAIDGGFLKGY